MRVPGRWLPPALALLLVGCTPAESDRPDWVIRSRLVFRSEDLSREREPLPPGRFRLVFPFVAGDLYGAPTTGDFLHPVLGPDYAFQLDLNRGHKSLLASLEPTELGLPYLRVEPAEARLARLAPMILEADGIEPLGRVEWFDADAQCTLLLLYVDRPASITGRTSAGGRSLRYSITVSAPGYVWVGKEAGVGEEVYTVRPRPARLLLAVALPDAVPAASPTRMND